MKKVIVLAALYCTFLTTICAQQADTVTVELARTSKIIFTLQDRSDLDQLQHYDFQALFDDILGQLESGDTRMDSIPDSTMTKINESPFADDDNEDDNEWDESDDDWDHHDHPYDHHDDDWCCDDRKVWHSMNFDFGINNYLENGSFPDYSGAQYTVRPWGSWYVGINSVLHTDFGRNWFAEWGFGVSWYNFKFQDDRTRIDETSSGVVFSQDPRPYSFEKSKLEATYLNLSVIPMYSFGPNHYHSRWWHHGHDSFRIGLGPYVGYRIESHSKQVYNVNGDEEVDKEKDNFYLNNFRYGLKLQFGTQGVEFFTAYDLNPLFAEGKGPDLHAITFGIVF